MESNYTKQALPEWQAEHPNARIMRNNIGMAWQGKRGYYTEIQGYRGINHFVIENPRPIFFGVGLPAKDKKTGHIKQKGGGDWIGWESFRLCDLISKDKITIPECMGVCEGCSLNQKVAVFLNLEIKSKDGKESPGQIRFRKAVQAAGGISIVLKECNHPKIFLEDWTDDCYNIECPDCGKSVSFDEIQERDNEN